MNKIIKGIKAVTLVFIPAVIVIVGAKTAFADFDPGKFVNNFNKMNDNKGFLFKATETTGAFSGGMGEYRLISESADMPTIDAYVGDTSGATSASVFGLPAGSPYAQTFGVSSPPVIPGESVAGKLNYDPYSGESTTSDERKLNLGVVFLYNLFASGNLPFYDYSYSGSRTSDAVQLQNAITLLMYGPPTSMDWMTNKYLNYLMLVESSPSIWLMTYDLNSASSYVSSFPFMSGDSRVFVMNVSDIAASSPRKDVLYLMLIFDNDNDDDKDCCEKGHSCSSSAKPCEDEKDIASYWKNNKNKYSKGSKEALVFVIDHECELLDKVKINGVMLILDKDYTISCIDDKIHITLNPGYLGKLNPGTSYPIIVTFTDGEEVSNTFTIINAGAPNTGIGFSQTAGLSIFSLITISTIGMLARRYYRASR